MARKAEWFRCQTERSGPKRTKKPGKHPGPVETAGPGHTAARSR